MVHNPSRELKEKTRHGNQLFPIAGYLWSGGSIPENVSLHWHPEYESGLLNRYKSKTSLSEDQAQDKLKELLSYLNDNFTQKLNVDDAAQKLKFSKPYFCRFFKKATGMSFIDYLNDLRLRKAARELLLSNREVVELASEFGFDNVSYFYRLFKRKFKVTPKEYRNLTVKASQDNLKE